MAAHGLSPLPTRQGRVGGDGGIRKSWPEEPTAIPQGSGVPGKRGRFLLLYCSCEVRPDLPDYASFSGGPETEP